MTVAAAHLSRSHGLAFLAWVIAIGWLLRTPIWIAEGYGNGGLDFLFPIIDGVSVAILGARAFNPKYPGRLIYFWVIALLTVQAVYRLAMTAIDPGWVMLILNRLFDLILLSILLLAAFRLIRIHRPGWHKRLWHSDDDARRAPLHVRLRRFVEAADAALAVEFRSENPDIFRPIRDAWAREVSGREPQAARPKGARTKKMH